MLNKRIHKLQSSGVLLSIAFIAASVFCPVSGCSSPRTSIENFAISPDWETAYGGIVRGDKAEKKIALIFTGGEHGGGTEHILDVLKQTNVKASLFVTGDYLNVADYRPLLKRAAAEGHYVGPHSHAHLLYCPWEDRNRTLVTEDEFKQDLQTNIDELAGLGVLDPRQPVFFIPPYEWYNQDQTDWAKSMDVILFNFTPGSGSNGDWIPEGHKRFRSSEKILADILEFEQKNETGLNGFLLLLHLGSTRKDKMHFQLLPLIQELQKRGYDFIRIDHLGAERI